MDLGESPGGRHELAVREASVFRRLRLGSGRGTFTDVACRLQDVLFSVGVQSRYPVAVLAFAIGQSRFLLEAKWLKAPVSADPLAKLHDRIRSRASGTRGVPLSMSGYTKAAPDAAANNKWPDVLLLDRGHFEAMLSGLTDPASLLTAVLDHASYHGGSYADLTSLLIDRQPCTPPTFTTVPPATLPWPVSQGSAAGTVVWLHTGGGGRMRAARLPEPDTLDRAGLKGEGGLLHGIRCRSYPSGHPGIPPRRTWLARP